MREGQVLPFIVPTQIYPAGRGIEPVTFQSQARFSNLSATTTNSVVAALSAPWQEDAHFYFLWKSDVFTSQMTNAHINSQVLLVKHVGYLFVYLSVNYMHTMAVQSCFHVLRGSSAGQYTDYTPVFPLVASVGQLHYFTQVDHKVCRSAKIAVR